ncbi:uncharacterized protein LOC110757276 isoform X2 [Prunus avium]|uniref:Uncharacterized protein LOC110757276 isoform X2 n=1 Tax=Prunus avium TaxID=42229 RepID=A0A6P5SF35_PRUAV|nr:uncharacterized protein LOC110757276 isoform X2 [Prunus avium]
MTLTRAATLSNNKNKKETSTLLPPQPLEQPCQLPQQQSTQPQQGTSSASGGGSRQQDEGTHTQTSSQRKNTHGRTVGAGTCDVVKKRKSLIPIRMDPSQKLVATIEAQKLFVSVIGLITRNKAPLNVLGMKKGSLEMKKDMALGLQRIRIYGNLLLTICTQLIKNGKQSSTDTISNMLLTLIVHEKHLPLKRSLVLEGL